MGTWGAGPFDNDDALDWVGELEEAAGNHERISMVRQAFRKVRDVATDDSEGEVESPEANVAVAAAALVAAGLPGGPSYAAEAEVSAVLEELVLPSDLVEPARDALAQVVRASEWVELWDQAEGLGAALDALRQVLDALGVDLDASSE